MNRIAWKIAARDQGWFIKNLRSPEGTCHWFSLKDLSHLPVEKALQYLSWWIQEAEMQGDSYGLELKGDVIPPGHGKQHLRLCLRALAIYQ